MNALAVATYQFFHGYIFQMIYPMIIGVFGVGFVSYLRTKRDKEKAETPKALMRLWLAGALIFITSSFYWMSFLDLRYDMINYGVSIVMVVMLLVMFIEKTPWWRFNQQRIDKYK